jgi:superfamily I DNA/RNA helicase
MLRRLADLLNDGTNVAQTMHAFAWRDYKNRADSDPPRSPFDGYEWDWGKMLEVLAQRTPIPKEEHLIIDEGQDLPVEFFRYAKLHAATLLTVFADEDQALSDRRTTLAQIRDAADLPQPRLLQNNHRNAPEIARLAEHFHSGCLPAANVQRRTIGSRPRLFRTQDPTTTAELIATWLSNRGGSIGVIVDSNPMGAAMQALLRDRLPDRRIDRYDHVQKNEDLINLHEDGITILNRESVKGQEFDSAFVLELERFLPWQSDAMRRVLYMICARARDYLTLVYGPAPLSAVAVSQLPGSDILERT